MKVGGGAVHKAGSIPQFGGFCSNWFHIIIRQVFLKHHESQTFFSSSKIVLIFSSFFCFNSLSRCSNENGFELVLWCGSSGLNTVLKSGRGCALICLG